MGQESLDNAKNALIHVLLVHRTTSLETLTFVLHANQSFHTSGSIGLLAILKCVQKAATKATPLNACLATLLANFAPDLLPARTASQTSF